MASKSAKIKSDAPTPAPAANGKPHPDRMDEEDKGLLYPIRDELIAWIESRPWLAGYDMTVAGNSIQFDIGINRPDDWTPSVQLTIERGVN